jgi:hypothetical protein
MASPRVVSALDRAGSPLRTHFLTGFRHFRCHFAFIYGSVPYGPLSRYFSGACATLPGGTMIQLTRASGICPDVM